MLVCQDLPDITNKPVAAPAGVTRVVQKKRAAEYDAREKAVEKHNRKVDEVTATDQKLKEATIVGMQGAAIKQRVATMAASVTMIEKKIELLKGNKDVLVAQWGEEYYNKQIAGLMTTMLDDSKLSGEATTMRKDDTTVDASKDESNDDDE